MTTHFDETQHPRDSHSKRFVEKRNSKPEADVLAPVEGATARVRREANLAAEAQILGRELRETGAVRIADDGFPEYAPERLDKALVDRYNRLAEQAIDGGYLPSHGLPLSEYEATALIRNENASPVLLEAVGMSDDLPWRLATEIALHPKASATVLHRVSDDPDTGTRYAVARHLNVSADTLDLMAGDRLPDVRATVAANPNTRSETQVTLAADDDVRVQLSTASRLELDQAAMTQLGRSRFVVVREVLAERQAVAA